MLSIAICTHNRAEQLQTLLLNMCSWGTAALAQLEVLVVDNASADNTKAVVEGVQDQLPLRYLYQPSLGLSHARNCALENFSGAAIWFLDDDTTASIDTLNCYLAALENRANSSYFGGPIEVDWQGNKPTWLKSDQLSLLNGLFGVYFLGAENQAYSDASVGPYGANFVLRRELVVEVGSFNTEFGVRGDVMGRGEESEYFQRARKAQQQGHYLADAGVGHRFQIERVTLPYLWRYGYQKGKAEVLLKDQVSEHWVRACLHQFILGLGQLLKGRRDHFYQCWINTGIARGRYVASQMRRG